MAVELVCQPPIKQRKKKKKKQEVDYCSSSSQPVFLLSCLVLVLLVVPPQLNWMRWHWPRMENVSLCEWNERAEKMTLKSLWRGTRRNPACKLSCFHFLLVSYWDLTAAEVSHPPERGCTLPHHIFTERRSLDNSNRAHKFRSRRVSYVLIQSANMLQLFVNKGCGSAQITRETRGICHNLATSQWLLLLDNN